MGRGQLADARAGERAAKRRRSRAAAIADVTALSAQSRREGDVHTIALRGELDLAAEDAVARELAAAERSDAGAIVLDLSEVTFIDSSGIRLLLLANTRSRANGNRLVLRRPSERVLDVLRLCGVERILPIVR
jgi:anti-anti-sigma factor